PARAPRHAPRREAASPTLRLRANHPIHSGPGGMPPAARAALGGGDASPAAARAAYTEARGLTVESLARAGVPCHVPEGGSYVFLDLGAFERPGRLPVLEALAAGGVLLAPGDAFGPSHASRPPLSQTADPDVRP